MRAPESMKNGFTTGTSFGVAAATGAARLTTSIAPAHITIAQTAFVFIRKNKIPQPETRQAISNHETTDHHPRHPGSRAAQSGADAGPNRRLRANQTQYDA